MGGIKRKGGAGMLAGKEERRFWQVEEESENSAEYKGCVYHTVYTWRKTPGEQT